MIAKTQLERRSEAFTGDACRRRSAFHSPATIPGRLITKVVPCPGALVTEIVPPCAATTYRTMTRPRPVPEVRQLPSGRARDLSPV